MTTKNQITSKTYIVVFAWLGLLTLIEIGAALLQIPRHALVILIVSTALGKALLIALYFMHLKFENRFTWLLPGVPVILAILFIAMLFPDMVFHLTMMY